MSYFKKLFTSTNPQDFVDSLAEVQTLITEQTNDFLMEPARENEVRATLFIVHPEKSPSPAGMRA